MRNRTHLRTYLHRGRVIEAQTAPLAITQRTPIAYRRTVLGWNIGVYRLPSLGAPRDGDPDAQVLLIAAGAPGERIAIWQTGLAGRNWIEELVAEGRAVDLGGNGYPSR